MSYPHDETAALELAMQLMAIPGGSGQEGEVAAFVVDKLRSAGAPAESICFDDANQRTPIAGQTGNLIFKMPGAGGPRRMLCAHLDTVPVCLGARPVIAGSMVKSSLPGIGIGADDRAGVAVTLTAAIEILRRDLPHPPLTFLWPVQEEIGLHGARCVRKSLLGKPKLAFNWDGGTSTKLTMGATGGYRMKIRIAGIASHAGGAPELGVSAIAIAGLAVADLQQNGWHGRIQNGKNDGTSNIGVIKGGAATNVVCDAVELLAEARSHNGRFRERIVREIEKAFRKAAKGVKSFDGKRGEVEFEGRLDYESFRLPDNDPSLLAAEAAVRSLDLTPQRAIANGGLDANWLTEHGIPTITLGCGQLNQHMASEALDIAEFQQACRLALCLATGSEK